MVRKFLVPFVFGVVIAVGSMAGELGWVRDTYGGGYVIGLSIGLCGGLFVAWRVERRRRLAP
jgi:hypothetical protein